MNAQYFHSIRLTYYFGFWYLFNFITPMLFMNQHWKLVPWFAALCLTLMSCLYPTYDNIMLIIFHGQNRALAIHYLQYQDLILTYKRNIACWSNFELKNNCFSLVVERVSVHKQAGWLNLPPPQLFQTPTPLIKRDMVLFNNCEVFWSSKLCLSLHLM